jgi:hypothetical protein
MTLVDGEKTAATVLASAAGTYSAHATLETWLDDDTVPTVFLWQHGSQQVYITGTFNGWPQKEIKIEISSYFHV